MPARHHEQKDYSSPHGVCWRQQTDLRSRQILCSGLGHHAVLACRRECQSTTMTFCDAYDGGDVAIVRTGPSEQKLARCWPEGSRLDIFLLHSRDLIWLNGFLFAQPSEPESGW